MNALRWLCLPVVCLGLTACETTSSHSSVPLTGDPLIDGPAAIQHGPARDRVLWQYRMALAYLRRGQYSEAAAILDQALARINAIYGPDKDARKARNLFRTESKKGFIGEPYERVMAYYYRGILYWHAGEPDNARACFRNAQIIDADTENKSYAADYLLPDYLDGFITDELGGDGADAIKRAYENAKMWRPPAFDRAANVFFFVNYGNGPTKFATGEYSQELRFQCHDSPVRSARVRVGGRDLKAPPYDDLCFQATTRGGRVMDHVLGNKAAFKGTTDTVGNVALIGGFTTAAVSDNRTTQTVGLGIALAGLFSKGISAATTPEADTRTWDNLPQFISFAAVRLPPGENIVTVEFLDATGKADAKLTKTLTVSIPSDRDKVVFVSDTSTTPQKL
jgi:hypothetical protein